MSRESNRPIYTHESLHASGDYNKDHVGSTQTSHHHETKGDVRDFIVRDGVKCVKDSNGTYVPERK